MRIITERVIHLLWHLTLFRLGLLGALNYWAPL